MPTLTVVAGPNGSGKSTLTRLGRETFQGMVVLDPDAIAKSMQTVGIESGSAIDAGRAVLLTAEQLLMSKQSFLVETTLSGNTYLRMMKYARELGYTVVLLFVGTADVSINLRRVFDDTRAAWQTLSERSSLRTKRLFLITQTSLT